MGEGTERGVDAPGADADADPGAPTTVGLLLRKLVPVRTSTRAETTGGAGTVPVTARPGRTSPETDDDDADEGWDRHPRIPPTRSPPTTTCPTAGGPTTGASTACSSRG